LQLRCNIKVRKHTKQANLLCAERRPSYTWRGRQNQKNTRAENIYMGKELLEVPMLLGTLFLRKRIL